MIFIRRTERRPRGAALAIEDPAPAMLTASVSDVQESLDRRT